MSATFFAVCALALGLSWAWRLPVRATLPERLAVAGVTAVFVAAWVGWLAVLALGYGPARFAAPVALLALTLAPAAVAAWERRQERLRGIRLGLDRRVDDRRFGDRRFRDRRREDPLATAPPDVPAEVPPADMPSGVPAEAPVERRLADRRSAERRAHDRREGERRSEEHDDGPQPALGPPLAAASAVSHSWARRQLFPRKLRGTWLLATGAPSLVLVFLLSTHYLPERDGGWGSAGSTWGDLALHAALAARVSQQEVFEWESPLVAGAPLTYPFLPDFLSGLLHRWGWSLRWGLLGPGVLVTLALVQLLFFTGWRAGRGRLAAVAAVALMLLGGSVVALPMLWEGWRDSGQPVLGYLAALRHDATHVPALNLRFSNFVCDALLPQRGMLVGLTAFLAVVPLLRGAWAGRPLLLVPVAFLLGALPFVHVHTFLALAGVTSWLVMARWLRPVGVPDGSLRGPRPLPRPGWWITAGWAGARPWLAAVAAGLLLAAPQLAWQLSHAGATHGGNAFSRWRLGWMAAPDENPFLFWARNLGVLLPFLVLAPWLLRRWRGVWLHLCASLLVLFAIANVYIFQPHDYDNLKLLFYAYLALTLVTARALAGWWRRGAAGRLAVVCVLVLGCAGGLVSVLRETTLRWSFLDRDEVELGLALRRLTAQDALFVTADRHNHPVPIVAGRRIVLGYRGWLWTHGIDAARHHRDVAAIYRGDAAAASLLRAYGVDYVVVGPPELKAYTVDEEWLAARFAVALAVGAYRVYDVAGGVASPASTSSSASTSSPTAPDSRAVGASAASSADAEALLDAGPGPPTKPDG
jgi:hypothetical protein